MLWTRQQLIEMGEDPSRYITKDAFDRWKEDLIHQKDLGDYADPWSIEKED